MSVYKEEGEIGYETCSSCGCGDSFSELTEAISNATAIDYHYAFSGVILDSEGETVRISYTGLLANSGAWDVFVAIEDKDNRHWKNTEYSKMNKAGNKAFEVIVPRSKTGNMYLAFKDGANNWDNNSGKNYSFNLQ